jgi:hypothetical protein
MSLTIKEKIKQAIDNSNDDQLLSIIYSMIENYNDDGIIGYDPKGNAYTKESLLNELEKTSTKMDNGEYLTAKEIENRVASWH